MKWNKLWMCLVVMCHLIWVRNCGLFSREKKTLTMIRLLRSELTEETYKLLVIVGMQGDILCLSWGGFFKLVPLWGRLWCYCMFLPSMVLNSKLYFFFKCLQCKSLISGLSHCNRDSNQNLKSCSKGQALNMRDWCCFIQVVWQGY